MADYSDFDIDRSTAQAWAEFQAKLAEIISMIDDSGDLRIGIESVTDAAPFVLFSSPERDLVRTEAAEYMVPSKIVVVSELPRLHGGKSDYVALTDRAARELAA